MSSVIKTLLTHAVRAINKDPAVLNYENHAIMYYNGDGEGDQLRQIMNLSTCCYRVVSLPLLLVAVVVFVFSVMAILPGMTGNLSENTGTDISPDTSIIYSAEELYKMAENYSVEGRAYYIYSRYTFDLIWPAVYPF